MSRSISRLAVAGLLLAAVNSFAQRQTLLLDKHWKFTKGDVENGAQPAFDDHAWQSVSVPHDWAIYGPFDKNNDIQITTITQNGETRSTEHTGRTGALPYYGIGWYRLNFSAPTFAKGKRAVLLFDGAMSNATVYVNGKPAGSWPYGYSSFWFDVTALLKTGSNSLAVRLDNKPESSRWYPGAGLYRNVHLVIKDAVSIKTWGTYVTTPTVSAGAAAVSIRTELERAEPGARIETTIIDATGRTRATNRMTTAANTAVYEQKLDVASPQLWSPESPYLYTAIIKLYKDNVLKDQYRTRFGIRTVGFRSKEGFFLNGKLTHFKGVCNHHDLGPLGSAVNTAALKRQLTILKDMGCNAIRTSHNPPAPELLDLCDEMGFMVMDESFDEWLRPKMKNGYHLYFKDWAEKDMMNLIHRDRNHPSIVLWSIGNEIPEQGTAEGVKVAEYLRDICHREDPTRLVTAAEDRIDAALKTGFAASLDVPGFNYKPMRYAEAFQKLPQGFLYGSETASTVSSRGVYEFPVKTYKMKTYADHQSSSYDLEACSWSQIPDDEFAAQDSLPYVMGEFVWTGFDYLGEPTPYDALWPSRSSYFGIVDLAGIPKDRYYLYRSRWNAVSPTLHLLPHWTWPGREGQVTPVFCYTNYPSAELFVNGKSQGVRRKSTASHTERYRLMWNDVVYEPGTLKVVAYDASGKPAATEEIRTAGAPHHLQLTADRMRLTADGKDLAFITAEVVDAAGNVCPTADNALSVAVTGKGSFRAICNGDPTSLELFHLPKMKAFSGKLVAVVQASDVAGMIGVEVSGTGVRPATLKLASTN